MRMFIFVACAVMSATPLAGAQSPSENTLESAQKPVLLTSCIPAETVNVSRFAPPPALRSRALYRSVGSAVLHVGHGIRVAGRLVPSPNVAAQAGAIDPTVPAMAFVAGDQYRSGPAPPRAPALRITTATAPVRVDCPTR